MPTALHSETLAQRTALRELAALSTIPVAWAGKEPSAIAAGLADVLIRSLCLDFAFVRMCCPNGGAAIEATRGDAWETFPTWLRSHLDDAGHFSRKEIVTDVGGAKPYGGVVIPIGVNGESGLVAAACTHSDFPTDIDQLLISVAVNHAAAAFQNAQTRKELDTKMAELREARNELEVKVAERTAKLTTANEDLRQQKEQLDGLFELSPDAVILVDHDFHVLRVNKEFTHVFWYTAEEAVGQGLRDLIVPEELHAEHLKYRASLLSGKRIEYEAIRQRKDGLRFEVSVVAKSISVAFDQVAIYLIYRDISEQKKAERKLRRSEATLLEGQRLVHMGSWAKDPSSGTVTCSPEMKRIFDMKSDQDTCPADLFIEKFHPEDRPVLEEIRRAQLDKRDYDASYRIVLPDGSIKHIYSVGHPVLNQSGELLEYIGTSMDVTEQSKARAELEKAFEEIKQRTEALRRSEGYLAEAQRLTHTGSWAWNVRTGALFWSQEIFRIYNYEPQQGLTWPQFLERVHPEDRLLIEQRAKMEASQKDWVDSELDFRIVLPDGTIKHLHSVARPVRDVAGEITEVVGTVMDVTEQWKARTELEKAFEEIKQRTEAARRSERELRDVVNTVPAHVWRTSPDGQVDFVNDRWLQFTGLALDDALGWKWEAVVHPDDRTRVVADFHAAVKNGQAMEAEARVRRADGEYCWWFVRNVPLRDETGKLVRWYGTAIDVEDRKQAEQALRKSEERWRSVFENSAIGVALTDLSGRFLATNHVYQTMLGYTEEELRALSFLDLTQEDYREANWAFVNELLEGKRRQFQIEKKYLRRDGSSIWVRNNVSLVPGTESVPRFIMALSEDITQRKRAEEALRRSEGYLAEAQKLTHTGSWAARVPQTENVYWSEEMYRIFGLDPGPTPPSSMEVARQVYPEDVPHRHAIIEQAIQDRTDFESDYRLLLPNGTIKYIHSVGHPVVNASGDVIQLVGTAMDVTDQHEARVALQRAFEQIKAEETELRRMTDAIATYIYVLRPDGTALYANQTALDYTGVGLEDLQSEDHRVRVFHPEDVERLREQRKESLARGVPFENEQRALAKDGKYRWFLIRYNPLRDDEGNIIRWYATGTDIEDRKQAEQRMRDENLALREQIDQAFMFEEIVGTSAALQTVVSNIVRVAPTDSTVLITGETGTGKELIARAIHKRSQRSGQAFISVNCASIPSSLIASELFGHEKGAFTGAVQRREGRFELAHSGTIFLDEIGELPAETQIALLRVLQERQFERVGGNQVLHTDVRVIAATNRDLTAAIASGTFRADLFYRLNVFPIELPPLRERKDDIPILVEYFVKRYADKAGKQIRRIDKNTLELCQSYPWPGNIRELQNIVERSMILTSGDTFRIENAWLTSPQPARQELPAALPDTLQSREREIIETALAESKGRVAGAEGAAAKLGIPPSTLESKIKQLKIKKRKFISE